MIGSWRPGGFPPEITLASKLILFGDMLVRGVDLVAGDSDSTARRLGVVESAAPLWLWGSLLITGSVIGYLSMIIRRGQGVFAGHLIGWVALWGLSVGVIIDVYLRAEIGLEVMVPSVATLIVGGIITALVGRVSGWEHARLTAAGLAISVALAIAAIDLDGLRNATILLACGAVHALLAIGTAAAIRQRQIEEEALSDGFIRPS